MGPVLIQLPPGLPYDQSRTETFFNILTKKFSTFRYAVEIRHKSWIHDDFFGQLQKFNIAFTIADSGNRYPYYEKVTTDFAYLRFHGNGQLYASDYSDPELDFYSSKIAGLITGNKDVWVFFNNDIHGYAINNAIRLKELTESKIPAPKVQSL